MSNLDRNGHLHAEDGRYTAKRHSEPAVTLLALDGDGPASRAEVPLAIEAVRFGEVTGVDTFRLPLDSEDVPELADGTFDGAEVEVHGETASVRAWASVDPSRVWLAVEATGLGGHYGRLALAKMSGARIVDDTSVQVDTTIATRDSTIGDVATALREQAASAREFIGMLDPGRAAQHGWAPSQWPSLEAYGAQAGGRWRDVNPTYVPGTQRPGYEFAGVGEWPGKVEGGWDAPPPF